MTAEIAVEEQLILLPAERPVPTRQDLDLALLPPHLDGVPDTDLVRSVETFGVIEPILVTVSGGSWTVQAGRRRVGAARKAGLTTVPAMVFKEEDWDPGVLTLVENMTRSPNPIAQAQIVARYIRQGLDVESIAHEVHIPISQLRALLPLTTLPEPFLEAVDAGKIAPGVAKQIAKLGEGQRDDLLRVLADQKKLGGKDVQRVREVKVAEVEQALIEGLADVSEVVETPWYVAVEELLGRALAICSEATDPAAHKMAYSIGVEMKQLEKIKHPDQVGAEVPF